MRHFRQVSGALAEFPEFPDGIQCLFQVQFPSSSGVIRAVPVIKAVGGIAILLALQWVSVLFLQALHIAFPPALLGMILLAVLLLAGVIREESVEDACTILIEKMGMLFLPAGISMLLYLDIIKAESIAIFITIIVSSLIILITTTAFVELVSKHSKGGKH